MKIRSLVMMLLALLLSAWILYPKFGGIKDTVVVEAGTELQLSDLGGMFLRAQTDLDTLDLSVPGEYPVTVQCLWRTAQCRIVVEDTLAPTGEIRDLTRFSTQIPEAGDFLVSWQDATAVDISFGKAPDPTCAGEQTVVICLTDLGGNVTELEASLTVIFDETPPTITGVCDHRVYLGTVLDLLEGVTVRDDLDENVTLDLDDGAVNWESAGAYTAVYRAVDVCGNETVVTALVTVIHDNTPPQLMGVTEMSICLGGTVAYRKGIVVTDDTDPSPVLTVDSSGVDLSRIGTYPVIYTAADCVGNVTVRETTITVSEPVRSYVEESVILEAVDRLLAKIITEDMTVRQQVQAIYDHLGRGYYYANGTDKSDWMQAAYKMMKTQRGDCFGFYALSRLLFERLGIPNLTVRRVENPRRSGNHWWSMVSVDGGQTWYHFDATPHMDTYQETCLVTDADLERFNRSAPGYYEWDRDSYPATPDD